MNSAAQMAAVLMHRYQRFRCRYQTWCTDNNVATYAIGDVQGCYAELSELLSKVAFSSSDHLWLAGDLVNRGPDSLSVVRLVRSLGSRATTVLGNHDLHLLAIYYGGHRQHRSDTFTHMLQAPDMPDIAAWYRQQPLLVVDKTLNAAMAHAGIPHIWSLTQAQRLAQEVSQYLMHGDYELYFRELYGNVPDCWHESLRGMDRLRMITNYFTRMRLIHGDGTLNFSHKGSLVDLPAGYRPWYQRCAAVLEKNQRVIFGHWAALEGLTDNPAFLALDTGCVWGRHLTALCLETGELTQVDAITG